MNPTRQRIRDARDREIKRLRWGAFKSWLMMFVPYVIASAVALYFGVLRAPVWEFVVLHIIANVILVAFAVVSYRSRQVYALADWAFIEPPPSILEEPDDDTVFDDAEDQAAWAAHARDGK